MFFNPPNYNFKAATILYVIPAAATGARAREALIEKAQVGRVGCVVYSQGLGQMGGLTSLSPLKYLANPSLS